jgi:hypothetical protein
MRHNGQRSTTFLTESFTYVGSNSIYNKRQLATGFSRIDLIQSRGKASDIINTRQKS